MIRSSGDRDQTTPVDQMTGQGWFTAELEQALLDGRADLAVHSAKDLPTVLAPGLRVGAHLSRADPRDALVLRDGSLADLPIGATVGSSSARRAGLLGALRADLRSVPLRGNVDTRLAKLDAGWVDALLLACAGLDRLGLGHRASLRLDPRVVVPAPAQGVIAIEVVEGTAAAAAVERLDDPDSAHAVSVERAVLSGLGGGCLLPLGVWCRRDEGWVVSAALAVEGALRRAEVSCDGLSVPAAAAAVIAALR